MKQSHNPFFYRNGLFLICLWLVLFIFFANIFLGCAGSEEEKETKKSERTLLFVPVTVPYDDIQKRMIRATSGVTIGGVTYTLGYDDYDDDGEASGYETIMRSGESEGDVFGMIVDEKGMPVLKDGGHLISNSPDFSSLIMVDNDLYNITQFESIPGAVYLMALNQNGGDGWLSAEYVRNIDVSDLGGLWMPSAGSITPWNTHIGGEVQEPDARAFENVQALNDIDDGITSMLSYFDIAFPFDPEVTLEDIRDVFDPYLYGYPFEVILNGGGSATVEKRHAMGRLSVAMVYVMPDEKTVYIADGGDNGGLFVFVADLAGNLASGDLYAAKWEQEEDTDGGKARLSWISLGHATEEEIRRSLGQGVHFSTIFNAGRRNPDGTCSDEYLSINTGDIGHECLYVRTGMEIVASRLETRRYAAMLGATTEFHSIEGLTFDSKSNTLYLSIGEVNNGMEDNMKNGTSNDTYDRGGANDIRLPHNRCGCVYGLRLGKNGTLRSNFAARDMFVLTCGEERSSYCNEDGIANPDNLTFIDDYDTLIIAEDSETGHENNALWAFNVESEDLTRIQTAPYGAEITSAYFYPDINGFSYLMSVVKHPFGGVHQDKLEDPADAAGYVGFIGAMPVFE